MNGYLSAASKKFKFQSKNQATVTSAQVNMVTLIKKLEIRKEFKTEAMYALLFAVGALIRYTLAATGIFGLKNEITEIDIEKAIHDDTNLMEIEKIQ